MYHNAMTGELRNSLDSVSTGLPYTSEKHISTDKSRSYSVQKDTV